MEDVMKTYIQTVARPAALLLLVGCVLLLNVQPVMAQQRERTAKPWLGVAIQDVSEKIAQKNKMAEESGAYVTEVTDKSPADSVGIEKGDVVVEFAGKQIEDANELAKAVQKGKVGEKVTIVVIRKGEKKSFQAVLKKAPRSRAFALAVPRVMDLFHMSRSSGSQGMHLMELNEQLGEYFGTPSGTGVLVERVEKESAAEKSGIKAGDVLLKVGKRTIDDLEDVSKAFSKFEEGDKAEVVILRKGSQKTVSLEIEESQDQPSFNIMRRGPGHVDIDGIPDEESGFMHLPERNGADFQIELNNVRPQIEIMKRNIEDMTKELRNRAPAIRRTIRSFDSRTI
jgi:S1-C subfamily serine protease